MYNEFDKEEFTMEEEEVLPKKKDAFWAEDADDEPEDGDLEDDGDKDDDEDEEEEELPPM